MYVYIEELDFLFDVADIYFGMHIRIERVRWPEVNINVRRLIKDDTCEWLYAISQFGFV